MSFKLCLSLNTKLRLIVRLNPSDYSFLCRVAKVQVIVFGVAHHNRGCSNAGIVPNFETLKDNGSYTKEVLVANGGFSGDAG